MLWHIHIHTSSDTSDEERLITLVPARAVQPFNNLRPKYRRDIFNIVGPKYFQQLAPKISSRYFHHRGNKIFSPPSTQKKSYYFLQSVPKIFPEYFHRLIRTYKFLWFTTIVGAIIELFLYYLDFFKDWFIVILVQSYMGNSNFLTIGGHGPRESHWHTDGYF